MDVIRCFALFCVISVHFLKHIGFYGEPVIGTSMYFLTVIRAAWTICVPLFLMLSGYLLKNKQPTPKYYKKLVKTLFIYALASVCCSVSAAYFQGTGPISAAAVIKGILSFSGAPYAWYVHMYIGLFLLIPYLNILYANLGSQKSKRFFLLTLLILTALPGILNIYRFDNPQWWLTPSSDSSYDQLIPSWWSNLYPITYYILGAYLQEFPLRMKRRANVLWILLVNIAAGTFHYYRSYSATFVFGAWQDWGSLLIVVQSVLVFHFLAQLNYDRFPPKLTALMGYLSNACFGAYLVSWIFEQIFYRVTYRVQPMVCRMKYYFILVPAVYICSLALSAVLNLVYQLLQKAVSAIPFRKVTAP